MAIVIRSYVEGGPLDSTLQLFVDPTATVVARFPSKVCDISIDDSDPDAIPNLDDFMRSRGYMPSPNNNQAAPPANIWDAPANPDPLNDEFNSDVLDPSWQVMSGGFANGGIDPYAGFAAGNTPYELNSQRRRSWLMTQPPANGVAQRLGKVFVPPVSGNYSVWMRGSFNTRLGVAIPVGPPITQVNNDNNLQLFLSTDPFSSANQVQMSINESDTGVIQAEFLTVVGGVPSQIVTTLNLWTGNMATPQVIEMVGVQMIGNTAHAWAVTSQGNAMYIGALGFAIANTIATAGISVVNASMNAPGNGLIGVDFFRKYDGALFLP